MRWQCKYHDSNGKRCELEATLRLHFSADHPFSFVDVCEQHLKEYKSFMWLQYDLENYGPD